MDETREARGNVSPSPRPTRRLRKLMLALAGAGIVGVAGYFGVTWLLAQRVLRQAEADLAAAIAELDAAEPDGWRWEDLERQRERVPDEQNGALVVMAASKLLPEKWQDDPIFDHVNGLPPPAQLAPEKAEALQDALKKLAPAVAEARKLVNCPRGRYPPLALTKDFLSTQIDYLQPVRDIAAVCYCDALTQCQESKPIEAFRLAAAVLHAGRSIGDEHCLVSQQTRIAT